MTRPSRPSKDLSQARYVFSSERTKFFFFFFSACRGSGSSQRDVIARNNVSFVAGLDVSSHDVSSKQRSNRGTLQCLVSGIVVSCAAEVYEGACRSYTMPFGWTRGRNRCGGKTKKSQEGWKITIQTMLSTQYRSSTCTRRAGQGARQTRP